LETQKLGMELVGLKLNDLNTARRFLGGMGTNTAALAFGGYVTAVVANTETWNGTSWSEVNNLNITREDLEELEQILQV
jgi:hypothetical protein